MKKKALFAMLILCMSFPAAACGEKTDSETAETQDTAAEEEKTEETDTDAVEKAEEEGDGGEEGEAISRIVSVDDVSDYVTIGEYKGLVLNRITATVTEDDIQTQIDYILEEAGTEVSDGSVESGDKIRISYTGTVDGEILDNGSQQNYDMTVGENMLGEEFDTGVEGMKKGDTREVTVNYPTDYYDSEVAGKTVVYTVNLQKIIRSPELTDEWVAANSEYKTVDEYRAGIQRELEEIESDNADINLYSEAWNQVLESSEVKEYPEEDLEAEKETFKNLYNNFLEEVGMTMDEFLDAQDMQEEEFDEQCMQYAEQKVKQNLIVQGIIDAENLSVEDEDTDELEEYLLQSYGFDSIDELKENYGEDEVNDSMALLRVERFIVSQAEVSEMTGTEDNLIANESVYDSDEEGSEESSAAETDSESMESESTEVLDESAVDEANE